MRHYEQAFAAGIPAVRTTRGVAAYNLACGYARFGRKQDALESLARVATEPRGTCPARGARKKRPSLEGETRWSRNSAATPKSCAAPRDPAYGRDVMRVALISSVAETGPSASMCALDVNPAEPDRRRAAGAHANAVERECEVGRRAGKAGHKSIDRRFGCAAHFILGTLEIATRPTRATSPRWALPSSGAGHSPPPTATAPRAWQS